MCSSSMGGDGREDVRNCRRAQLVRYGVRTGVREHVSLHDLDFFLADHAVHDPERAELPIVRSGGDQHVVRLRLGGVGDVGARRVRLGGGVRVVDHHGHLVAGVHVPVEPQQVAGVELVEGRRAGGVQHRDEALRAVGAVRPGDHPARLVRVVPAGVRDDLLDEIGSDHQHVPSVRGADRPGAGRRDASHHRCGSPPAAPPSPARSRHSCRDRISRPFRRGKRVRTGNTR